MKKIKKSAKKKKRITLKPPEIVAYYQQKGGKGRFYEQLDQFVHDQEQMKRWNEWAKKTAFPVQIDEPDERKMYFKNLLLQRFVENYFILNEMSRFFMQESEEGKRFFKKLDSSILNQAFNEWLLSQMLIDQMKIETLDDPNHRWNAMISMSMGHSFKENIEYYIREACAQMSAYEPEEQRAIQEVVHALLARS